MYVHARGAIVTRAVALPADLPVTEVDLVIGEVTPLADAGSVRAEVTGARPVVSVVSALRFPSVTAQPGASVERVAELTRLAQRLTAERNLLEARIAQLRQLAPVPPGRLRSEKETVDARFADALATSALMNDVLAQLDERVAALDVRAQKVARELEAAALDDAQRASAERLGVGHPMREVTVRLDAAGANAALESLLLSYVVPAARWWPAYTLRLSDGGTRASWWLEALVAQGSGEDWQGARISLATADLVRDARLPELPSLRLGRAQPPPKKAYRPPPAGLDRMFEAYDDSRGGASFGAPPPPRKPAPAAPRMMPQSAPPPMQAPSPVMVGGAPGGGATETARARRASTGSMAPAAAMPPAPPMASRSVMMDADAPAAEFSFDSDGAPPEPEAPAAIEPADAWLDFDALTMAGLDDVRRGRLTLAAAPAVPGPLATVAARIDALTPTKLRDPRQSRGLFDHRYEVAGVADIPSDGALHRLTVGIAEAPSQLRWKTVPRQVAEVYKEARLTNPFASPLLAGPVDVFVEGSLLLTSEIDRIDVGGDMTIGLGVEDNVRVARNARVDEATAGLLGGGVVVDSEVTIELTSSLGKEATVEVLDRIPVSDEDDLEVSLVSAKPDAAKYTQEERGAPIRHGLRWLVPLPPAGKSKIVFRYKLSFSGKSEIAGGNRRE